MYFVQKLKENGMLKINLEGQQNEMQQQIAHLVKNQKCLNTKTDQ